MTASPSQAQQIPDSRWAVFREADGLVDSDLSVVLPDDGAIWFGGQNGVSRFDGTWVTYPLDATTAAPADEDVAAIVTALAFDDHHNVLAGTRDGRVYKLDDRQWQQLTAIATPIQALEYIDGAIWAGTDAGLLLIKDGVEEVIPALAGIGIHAIHPGIDTVWIGAANGLWQVTPDAAVARPYKPANDLTLPAGAVTAITQDKSGVLWLGAASALVKFQPEKSIIEVYSPLELQQRGARITGIGVGTDATVWVATHNSGAVAFTFVNGEQETSTPYGSGSGIGLDTDVVHDLAVDAEGTIWFATPIGAARYYEWAWASAGDEFAGLPISHLATDTEDNLWIATQGEGVFRLSIPQMMRTTYYPGAWDLADANVPSIEVAADGRVWAATLNGLSVFAGGHWQNPIDAGDLPSPQVNALAVDADGVWIGTAQGLAHHLFTTQTTTVEPEFAGQALTDLQMDGLGSLWELADAGQLHVRTAAGAWLPADEISNGMPANTRILAIAAPRELRGIAYAAVENNGVFRWNGSAWEQYGPHDEWLDGHIQTLRLDADGRSLWIGSNIGVGRLDEVGLTIYDAHDGAASGAIRSIEPAQQGGYWFGGQKGLWHFKPEPSAPVLTAGAAVGGVEQSDSMLQAYTDQQLSLYFETGDMHSTADRIQAFYRVGSADQPGEWQRARGRSLPLLFDAPGIYNIEVVARALSFNYSAPLTRTVMAVTPPLTVAVPILGKVEARIFSLMAIFAAIACVGLGYTSYEYLSLRRRVNAAIRRGFNPYVSGEPVRRPDMFFGRHELVARIIATLHNNSIMIHGERRIGKTTLLYQLASMLRKVEDKDYWFLPIYVDMEGTTETELFYLLMEDILAAVSELPELGLEAQQQIDNLRFWTQRDGDYDDRTFGRDMRVLMLLLEEYAQVHQRSRQMRLILLMDEMDTLSRFDHVYQQQLRRIFMRDFAATLGAVVAGIELSKEWDRVESPWFNLFNEIEIQPLTDEAARELLVKPVQNYYHYNEDALQFVIAQCEGRPFRLQQYGLEAVNQMLRRRKRHITMADVMFAHNLIQSEMNLQAAQAGLTRQVASGETSRTAPPLLSPT